MLSFYFLECEKSMAGVMYILKKLVCYEDGYLQCEMVVGESPNWSGQFLQCYLLPCDLDQLTALSGPVLTHKMEIIITQKDCYGELMKYNGHKSTYKLSNPI